MNDDREILDHVLGGVLPPEPPYELQARVLREATVALTRRPRWDAWTRLWESRPLRVAWAAAVLALVAANAALPGRRHPESLNADGPPASTAPREANELDAIARLPRIDLGTLPAAEGPAPPAAERPKPAHSRAKSKESAT
jgi:hypothetical protein